MKKFIFLAIFPLVGFSQEKTQINQFSVFVTPEINGMKLSHSEIANTYDLSSNTQTALSAGLNWERGLKKNFSFITGLGYGFKRCYHEVGNWEVVDPQVGVLDGKMENDFQYHELQVPLLLKYSLNKRLYFTGGLEIDFVLFNQSKSKTVASNGYSQEDNASFEKAYNFAPTISLGYYFPNIKLSAEPQFNYYLIRNMTFQSNFYRFGIKFSYHI